MKSRVSTFIAGSHFSKEITFLMLMAIVWLLARPALAAGDSDVASGLSPLCYFALIIIVLLIAVLAYLLLQNQRLKANFQAGQGSSPVADCSEESHRLARQALVGQMAGGIAHDLNNILSGLVSYPELLLMQLPADSSLRKPIGVIHESGLRAAVSVSDLLTASRDIAAYRNANAVNALALESLQSQDWEQLCKLYPGIRVETKLTDKDTKTLCSSVHLGKCIINLVQNAAESLAGEGRIELTTDVRSVAEAESARLEISSGEYLLLSVSDDGAPISEADLAHLFEPFYTKKQMGRNGSGIGLAVVKAVAEDHGGTVRVVSSETGNCFTMYLPMVQ